MLQVLLILAAIPFALYGAYIAAVIIITVLGLIFAAIASIFVNKE